MSGAKGLVVPSSLASAEVKRRPSFRRHGNRLIGKLLRSKLTVSFNQRGLPFRAKTGY